jgi:hypothetical protein
VKTGWLWIFEDVRKEAARAEAARRNEEPRRRSMYPDDATQAAPAGPGGLPAGHPHFGHHHGLPVHLRTKDFAKAPAGAGPVTRFNSWLALKVTGGVGTMWCAYVFAGIAIYGLPTALKPGGEGLVSWIAQTFLQLVLLSIIIVGGNVAGVASEARAAKTFDDAESIKDAVLTALDRLDCETEGGLKAVLDAISTLGASPARQPRAYSSALAERLHQAGPAQPPQKETP